MMVWIVFINEEPDYGEGYGTYARPLKTFVLEEQAQEFIKEMTGQENVEEGRVYDRSYDEPSYDEPTYYYLSCDFES